jgi:ribokinase
VTRQPAILVVGYNAWDVGVILAETPRRDAKHEVPPITMGGGGPGATAAVALGRLGARVQLMTPLTDDAAGRMQAAELAAAGLDLALCPVHPGHASPMAVILVDPAGGDRTILWSRGDVPHLPAPPDPAALLAGVDLLYVDGHEPTAALPLAVAAGCRGLPVVMDAGSVREGSAELAAACSDVISSRIFAPDLTGRADPREALLDLRARGPAYVALTAGRDGVLALDGDRWLGVPAFAVAAVDTTGAGDAFHAGYALARAEGQSFAACLRFGAATAALKCLRPGGRPGLPDRAAVETLLREGVTRPLGGVVADATES